MEEFKMPEEEIGDKKEEQKQSAKVELPEHLAELKKREKKKNWLKEKFDVWRHEK
jgi:hypothetical protein